MESKDLIQRLKDRKIVQWALAYGAAALVLLEVADILADAFDWPTVALRTVTVLVGYGFLAILVMAWFHGERGHQRVRMVEVVLLLGIAVAGGTTAWWVGARAIAAETRATSADAPQTLAAAAIPDDGRTGVAVLPFASIGNDADNASFADGIHEDVIAELARIDGLRVISRTSTLQYRQTEKRIPEIARELGVHVILEGSVRRVGADIRIVAQLIDARTDEHFWAHTYDRKIKDILQVQSDVARDLAAKLSETLGADVRVADLAGPRPEVDPAAVELMLEGRRLANSDVPADRKRAAELLDSAVNRDVNLASTAFKSMADLVTPDLDLGTPDPPRPDPDMIRMVERALQRAPNSPAAHTFSIRKALDRADFGNAEALARQAVAESPNNASAHRYFGLLLGRRNEFDEAVEHLKAAYALDPNSAAIGADLGEMLYAAGRFDEAIGHLTGVLRKNPGHVGAQMNLGLAYQAKGDHARARAALEQAAAKSRNNPLVLGSYGYVLAQQGEHDRARAVLDTLRMSPTLRGASSAAIAQVLAGLGEGAEAARWLQRTEGGEFQGLAPRIQFLRMDSRLRRETLDSTGDTLRNTRGDLPRPRR